jgi:hypothetical protein
MNIALVYLAILLVMAALFFGLSRQLGHPSGWFGRRVMGKANGSSTSGSEGAMRST